MNYAMADSSVVIVGGGIAGLSAAEHLHANGIHNVTVLEATHRLGGRMRTVEFGKTGQELVELGANWIHGETRDNSVFALAENQGLLQPYVILNGSCGPIYCSDGSVLDGARSERAWRLFESWAHETENPAVREEVGDISIASFMDLKLRQYLEQECPREHWEDLKCVFKCYLNQLCLENGADPSIMPAGADPYQRLYGGDVNIPLGMKTVIDALRKKLPDDVLQLNSPVTRIHWEQDGPGRKVTIRCGNGRYYKADHCIVTSSLGFLKENCVSLFQPALPKEKLEAISSLCFGTVDKIFLYFDKPFWEPGKGNFRLACASEDKVIEDTDQWYKSIVNFEEVYDNPNVLVAWLHGEAARHMETLPEREIISTCTQVIRQFLGHPSIPAPSAVLRSQWHQDPWTRGSYMFWGWQSHTRHVEALQMPLCDNDGRPLVLFAGEATIQASLSTMHGGRDSGLREAQRLLGLYRNPKSAS